MARIHAREIAMHAPALDGCGVLIRLRFLDAVHQGHKEWLAEVHFLGVVEHRNLVKLIGYCASQTDRGPQRLLVYEFMPNKTLDDHLFNRAYPVLPWDVRLQIALGAAEGLLYLHEGLELQVAIFLSTFRQNMARFVIYVLYTR